MVTKKEKAKAGHQEIQGETIAKFEFFEQGYNPYSRYLDVDKIDLILRKKEPHGVKYIEVQVKYGRLYTALTKNQAVFFDHTSWKIFKLNEFEGCSKNLFVAYVLSHPEGYKGDIFIFKASVFNDLIKKSVISKNKKGDQLRIMCIAKCRESDRWYLWRSKRFTNLNDAEAIEVTKYRRNFDAVAL